MANGDCPMLKEGKLYPCTFVPNIPTFNKYFEKNIEVCDYNSPFPQSASTHVLDNLKCGCVTMKVLNRRYFIKNI